MFMPAKDPNQVFSSVLFFFFFLVEKYLKDIKNSSIIWLWEEEFCFYR